MFPATDDVSFRVPLTALIVNREQSQLGKVREISGTTVEDCPNEEGQFQHLAFGLLL